MDRPDFKGVAHQGDSKRPAGKIARRPLSGVAPRPLPQCAVQRAQRRGRR
jgi:hypothetical protein